MSTLMATRKVGVSPVMVRLRPQEKVALKEVLDDERRRQPIVRIWATFIK